MGRCHICIYIHIHIYIYTHVPTCVQTSSLASPSLCLSACDPRSRSTDIMAPPRSWYEVREYAQGALHQELIGNTPSSFNRGLYWWDYPFRGTHPRPLKVFIQLFWDAFGCTRRLETCLISLCQILTSGNALQPELWQFWAYIFQLMSPTLYFLIDAILLTRPQGHPHSWFLVFYSSHVVEKCEFWVYQIQRMDFLGICWFSIIFGATYNRDVRAG